MVLQREKPLPVCGTASPDEKITVRMGQRGGLKPDFFAKLSKATASHAGKSYTVTELQCAR